MHNDTEQNILIAHMGPAFQRLNPILQRSHLGTTVLRGPCDIKQGKLVSKMICVLFRFPKEGNAVSLAVKSENTSDRFSWKRNFNGLRMNSTFKRQGDFLVEQLGPLAMSFKAIEKNGELHYVFSKTRFFGIPIPQFLSPQIDASEKSRNGKYLFSVKVRMFLVGLVIAYRGELKVETQEQAG